MGQGGQGGGGRGGGRRGGVGGAHSRPICFKAPSHLPPPIRPTLCTAGAFCRPAPCCTASAAPSPPRPILPRPPCPLPLLKSREVSQLSPHLVHQPVPHLLLTEHWRQLVPLQVAAQQRRHLRQHSTAQHKTAQHKTALAPVSPDSQLPDSAQPAGAGPAAAGQRLRAPPRAKVRELGGRQGAAREQEKGRGSGFQAGCKERQQQQPARPQLARLPAPRGAHAARLPPPCAAARAWRARRAACRA